MGDIKTNTNLLDALRSAASHKPTAEEIREQRVSFIFGSLDQKSGVTRSRIEETLDKQEGR